jgi:hypothetical protein
MLKCKEINPIDDFIGPSSLGYERCVRGKLDLSNAFILRLGADGRHPPKG